MTQNMQDSGTGIDWVGLIAGLCLILGFAGCAIFKGQTYVAERQDKTLDCVKELKANDFTATEAFEICRQIYGLKKVDDSK
jgi:hypothetical protein